MSEIKNEYLCPECRRTGMYWDGRAKILLCPYKNCNYVVRIPKQKKTPTHERVLVALDKVNTPHAIPHKEGFSFAITTLGTHQDIEPFIEYIQKEYSIYDKSYGDTGDILWIRCRINHSKKKHLIKDLVAIASKISYVPTKDVLNWSIKKPRIVRARSIICYILRERYKKTHAEVAKLTGAKTELTIRACCKKFRPVSVSRVSLERAYRNCASDYMVGN